MNRVSSTRQAVHQPPPSTGPISLDHGLQVYLQTRSIMASKFTRSWPPKCISKLARLRPPYAYLQTRLITASKCISKLARSRFRSASLSSLDQGLQVYLQIRWITASKCISKLARSQPRRGSLSSLDRDKIKSSLSISPCHDHELTPSTAYSGYSIH